MDDNVVRLCINGRKIEPGINAQLYTLRDVTRLPTGGWTNFLRSTRIRTPQSVSHGQRMAIRWNCGVRFRRKVRGCPTSSREPPPPVRCQEPSTWANTERRAGVRAGIRSADDAYGVHGI